MIQRYLLHEKLLIRFGALMGIVLIALLGSWGLAYWFLPEGVLRGRTGAQLLAGNDLAGGSVWLEWLRILVLNLAAMFLLVIAPNTLRSAGGYPLGYGTVLAITVIFGITLGTDSFSISMGGKISPSPALFMSSGVYEIAAYVLAATATVSIAKYRLAGVWPKQTLDKIGFQSRTGKQDCIVGILLALAILVAACGWEAYRIAQSLASVS